MPALHISATNALDLPETSGSSALASFLIAAVLRAKRFAFSRQSEERTNFLAESRIPASQIDKLPNMAVHQRHRRSVKRTKKSSGILVEKYDTKDDSIPQSLTDEVAQVHDRLPDPKLWEKLNLGTEVETSHFDSPAVLDTSTNAKIEASGEFLSRETDLVQQEDPHPLSKRNISANLEGVMRRRQLYCRNGYHLQILSNGRVSGTRKDHSRYGILEFVSVNVGIVTIRGVETGLYLAMDSKGRLYGSEILNQNCFFKENFEENKYNTYSSLRHRNHSNTRSCFVAISQQGKARSGCRSKESQKFTHFLPRLVDPRKVPWHYEGEIF